MLFQDTQQGKNKSQRLSTTSTGSTRQLELKPFARIVKCLLAEFSELIAKKCTFVARIRIVLTQLSGILDMQLTIMWFIKEVVNGYSP